MTIALDPAQKQLLSQLRSRKGPLSVQVFWEQVRRESKLEISYSHFANIMKGLRSPDHPAVLRFMGLVKGYKQVQGEHDAGPHRR